ncbi:hypothetical protein TcWFU_009325 [Taenia crassiceps]|uniref:Uncharacterized protein n=1 Tax=Taenia crassiceps TaxID=6207 RepID=A0ABR4Q166_9CEST
MLFPVTWRDVHHIVGSKLAEQEDRPTGTSRDGVTRSHAVTRSQTQSDAVTHSGGVGCTHVSHQPTLRGHREAGSQASRLLSHFVGQYEVPHLLPSPSALLAFLALGNFLAAPLPSLPFPRPFPRPSIQMGWREESAIVAPLSPPPPLLPSSPSPLLPSTPPPSRTPSSSPSPRYEHRLASDLLVGRRQLLVVTRDERRACCPRPSSNDYMPHAYPLPGGHKAWTSSFEGAN